MNLRNLTWTCEVCGKERPDQVIDVAVATGTLPASQAPFAVNVKYCKDDPDCRHAAQVVANHRRDELEGGEQLSLDNY